MQIFCPLRLPFYWAMTVTEHTRLNMNALKHKPYKIRCSITVISTKLSSMQQRTQLHDIWAAICVAVQNNLAHTLSAAACVCAWSQRLRNRCS
jgi:hypothetical protein